ncbi:hypothetical protein SDRG_05035 [Saprolegnia diclina VS20]|uniref:C2 domain-containing protein n=1 Tax=Saprolegnia diclina (strain VS20) TaxID=1156394 RepID=T0S3T2_SAPDV|nr:hypothetical protein SDRG_05035 [Saprolegnia diclina VS20]EQC37432.1 hypothetical protein SDRG_05035 [Saprolegnia diclina VS20]|eukprot:XP_008608952.1 hypothetical protein SDRG_05035 [Saprolegnia diclina VS20]
MTTTDAAPTDRRLRLTLHAARDLAAADYTFGGISRGKSDPYVVLRIGDQRFTSSCIASTLNPVWGAEVFEFVLTQDAMYASALVVEVYDHDLFNADDLIGSTVLALAQFEMDKTMRSLEWPLDVPDEFSSQKVHSVLLVTVQVLEPYTDPSLQAEIVDEMVETQKWRPISGWGHSKMETTVEHVIPAAFTSPVGWVIALHEPRQQSNNEYCDDDLCPDGWLYAASWDGPWYKSAKGHPTALCRKRKWTKTYVRTRRALSTTQQDKTIDAILGKYGLTEDDDDDDNQWLH